MIGWRTASPQLVGPIDDQVRDALRLVRSDAVAVMMYGSRARGTERPDSDIDILAVVDNRPGSFNDGHVSISYYTSTHLSELAKQGSLFVRHLRDEGKIFDDSRGILTQNLASYIPRLDYSSLRSDLTAVLTALSVSDRGQYELGLRKAGLWAARSAAYIVCAERGEPVFDVEKACRRAGVPQLANLLRNREEVGLDELQQAGMLTLGVDSPTIACTLVTMALNCWDSNHAAARILESVVAGKSQLEYTQLTIPIV
jgi:hypothetical protein